MRHLTEEGLVDLAEGTRPEISSPHLASCATCQRALAELRSLFASAADVEVPEPSPLFWDHFSARVREAVDAERQMPVAAATGRWLSWPPWPVFASIGAVAALLLVAALSWLPVGNSGAPVNVRGGSDADEAVQGAAEILSLRDDPSLSLLADLTGDLDWDGVAAAGLTPRAGAVDGLVAALNREQRQELQRLLQEALSTPGA